MTRTEDFFGLLQEPG